MKRTLVVAAGALALAGVAACGSSHVASPPASRHVHIAADKPPSPATWPAYPRFSRRSCWARPFLEGEIAEVDRRAPSYKPAPRSHPIPPATVVKRLLARFGDRRYVKSIVLSPAPAAVGSRVHVLYAGGHPPAGALRARIVVPAARARRHSSPEQSLTTGIAEFEGEIVGGALRDDLCDAGGPPLVMWETSAGGGFAERNLALDQRFPNPTPASFRKRVALVGRRYGFRVASLLLLRPRDIAPVLIVTTDRPRKAFVKDVPRVMALLDPSTTAGKQAAQTFEAFFFAARDAKGPFLFTQYVSRGESEGGEWAANRCLYPYPTIGLPVRSGAKEQSCS